MYPWNALGLAKGKGRWGFVMTDDFQLTLHHVNNSSLWYVCHFIDQYM